MQLEFIVLGTPRGKARHRTAGGHAYTPKETVLYENRIAGAAASAMNGAPLMEGPLVATVIAVFIPPKSESKRRQALMLEGTIRPTKKPDWDNIAKCLDGLNGIVFRDDAQIVTATVHKFYGPMPHLKVEIKTAGD